MLIREARPRVLSPPGPPKDPLIRQIPEALGTNFVQAGPITLRANAGPKNVFAGGHIEEDERTRFKLAGDGFGVGRREDAVLVAATLQSRVFIDADRSSARGRFTNHSN